jgi:tryptophan synthase beta subunit
MSQLESSNGVLAPSLFALSVFLAKLTFSKKRTCVECLKRNTSNRESSNTEVNYVASDNKLLTSFRGSEKTASGAAYDALIGNTPMVKLSKLSKIVRRDIWVKMESLNPGGTGKDRASLYMVRDLIAKTCAPEGSRVPIVEGTSGSTGIALASICNALGHPLYIVMPDDQAEEKKRILETLGATVKVVPSCSIANKGKKLTINKSVQHYDSYIRPRYSRLKFVFVFFII